MAAAPIDRRFGYAWLVFACALALHVTDEATHDFLSTYNARVEAIHARLPFLPLPTFTFPFWLGGLLAGITLRFCLSPYAFRGSRWLRSVASPFAFIVGISNACLHILSSIYYQRWMPGVYSSPLLLTAALFLLATSRSTKPNEPAHSVTAH